MGAKFSGTHNVTASLGQLMALLKDARFSTTLNLELKTENPTPSGVWYRFHHGVTFTSWGEKITVTLTPISDNSVNVEVFSECALATQVIDFGKNRRNADAIMRYIDNNIARYSHVSEAVYNSPATGVKYCYKCGKQLSADSAFCTACGTKQPE